MSLWYLDKIREIVNNAIKSRGLDGALEPYGPDNKRTRFYYYCDFETLDAIAHDINDDLLSAGLAPEWVAYSGLISRRRPELGYFIEVRTHVNDGCPELQADVIHFKLKVVE